VREIAEALLDVLKSGQRGALATLVRASGSTPHRPGARMLLRADGTMVGTVGGGAIEREVLEALRRALATNASELLVRQLGYDLGMCCGGRMEIFVEPIEPVPRLVLCGAGHVAKATAPIAKSIGFEVVVVDEREELNTPERFDGCTLELQDPSSWLRRNPLGERDWLLIVTHDHQLDEQVFELALGQAPRYIGLVGSRRKTLMITSRVAERLGQVALDRVFAPVGLDLGALGPGEVAVAIAAELVALRRGKPAAHLRALDAPSASAETKSEST
jgi:xanthine dehydrogenase accessory factor